MLNGEYRPILNRQAMQVLNVSVDIPEPSLGIGFAENLAFMKMEIVPASPTKKAIIPKLDEYSIEQASINAEGNLFSPEDFPRLHWLGD
jgi:hypothetical protein